MEKEGERGEEGRVEQQLDDRIRRKLHATHLSWDIREAIMEPSFSSLQSESMSKENIRLGDAEAQTRLRYRLAQYLKGACLRWPRESREA